MMITIKLYRKLVCIFLVYLFIIPAHSQKKGDQVQVSVHFEQTLQLWDGFGINYVETSQTPDYAWFPQEYGGFSLLDEAERRQILELVFGENGLKPGVTKLFLDPFHQESPDSRFDHTTSTQWMRYFNREGLEITRKRGGDLTMITTLYGPPAWATQQKFLRGRDLDPEMKEELANYMIQWVKYCREVEGFPIKYISVHNEGEAGNRWPNRGECEPACDGPYWFRGHDYNMYWPTEQVVDFLSFMQPMLNNSGLEDVSVSNGECTFLSRFKPYAEAIIKNTNATKHLGILTSHGFRGNNPDPSGLEIVRKERPDIHSWITSMSWGKESMNVHFLRQMYNHIYLSKVNSINPWAAFQRPVQWRGGDPNPGTAFYIYEDGSYEVLRGYNLYKQICPIGQPGMHVVQTSSTNDLLNVVAFTDSNNKHPDAFLVINESEQALPLKINISGNDENQFEAYRTDDYQERNKPIGDFQQTSPIMYTAPARSATTFIAK